MKRIYRLIRGFITAPIMLTLLVSCNDKKNNDANFNLTPPKVETTDGELITLSCGNFYPIKLNEINEEYAKKLCMALGKDYSEEVLNNVRFGENIFGVGLASVVYFGKYLNKLSDEEWEILINIAENPQDYEGVLSGEGSSENQLLSTHASQASRIPDAAYFDAMIDEVANDLQNQKKMSRSEAYDYIYSAELKIKTPYSTEIQTIVDEVYSDASSFTDNAEAGFPQSACAIIDNNGGVVAIAGGNNGNTAYNRAYRIPKKIGSAIKPLAVYTPAIESNLINFSSHVDDEPFEIQQGENTVQWPSNYDGKYEGTVTVTYALRQSKNTVAVRLTKNLVANNCLDFIQNRFHFSTLTEEDSSDSAMAMGYLSRGVSLTELAAAYSVFGNNGVYNSPYFYTEVLDGNGNVVLTNNICSEQAIDSQDAWIMNRLLMYNVSQDDGIANAAQLDNGVEVIGKTGTVDNENGEDTDKIFAGVTPDYSAVVWVGYDAENAAISNKNYKSPTEIWKKIMEQLPLEKTQFSADESVIMAEYCTVSGGLAESGCPEKEIGYYKADSMPDKCDAIH